MDALDRYDCDAIRYYLTVAMPENRDTDWDWEEFYQRNNSELVATWGATWSIAFCRLPGRISKAKFLNLIN